FGAIGVVWAVAFYFWFRDNPRDHPSVNSAELALLKDADQNAAGHRDVPWGTMLSSPTVWLLWFQYFCLSYGWYFYLTWLPTYLKEARGLTGSEQARLAGYPLFFGGLGCLVAGIVSARLLRWLGTTARTRRALGFVGFTAAAGLLLAAAYISD